MSYADHLQLSAEGFYSIPVAVLLNLVKLLPTFASEKQRSLEKGANSRQQGKIPDRIGLTLKNKKYVISRDKNTVFTASHRITQNYFTTDYQLIITESLGINSDISTYFARHTFATMMHDLGASLMTIKDVIGHEDIKSTQQYIAPNSKSQLLDFQERLLSNSKS